MRNSSLHRHWYIAGSAEGTVFPTSIKQKTKINSLFDTGATKSVMSGDMYKRLKLGPLDTKRLPKVVGADGTSLPWEESVVK